MNLEHAAFLIGKILLGGYFLYSGLNHFINSGSMTEWVRSKGLPRPKILVYLSGLTLALGGLGIILGLYPVLSILAISTFLLVVSPTMHDFWNMEGNQRQNHLINFTKNIAILGALLALVSADWTVYGLGITLGLI